VPHVKYTRCVKSAHAIHNRGMDASRRHSYSDSRRVRGLVFFIGYWKRPVLDIQVIDNPIYHKNKLVKKEFYFYVTNNGQSTARNCRVTIAQRPFVSVKKGEVSGVAFEQYRIAYLDWFEPSALTRGQSSDLRTKLGKFVDLFPDPNHHLLVGTLEVHVNMIGKFDIMSANIVTEDETEGEERVINHRTLAPHGLTLAGEKHVLRVVFSWEREFLKSCSKYYLLNLKSLEKASLTPCPNRFPDERFPSFRF